MSEATEQLPSLDLVPLVKAHFIGVDGGVQSTLIREQEQTASFFATAGALAPAYDPSVLAMIYENSSALRPNVDAYVTNIDSFGHCFVPSVEVDSLDADGKIKDALRLERVRAKRDSRNATNVKLLTAEDEPSEKEVQERKKQLDLEIRMEHAFLKAFFENCSYDMPFSGPEGLRGLTRQDIEVLGSGYWEVLRNGLSEICQFNYVPAISVRMMPVDEKPTEVEVERRISLLSTEKVKVQKRFRRYVQVHAGDANIAVYFKEFGDPRVVSAKTGRAYATIEDMRKQDDEKESLVATEILAFKISSPRSPYGVPRWIGTALSVLGTRQAEEVNFLYFENRSVPPMAILVSGGRLHENAVKRVEDYIATEIKGKRNFHKILVLEAEGSDSSMHTGVTPRMKIEIKQLTDSQQKDGLFQNYDERNSDKVGQAFRLPRILRGDVRDFNRSTAEASINFAETQVFGPIRQQFDWMVNRFIFPALGVKHHLFKSNAPTVRDPEELSRMIALLTGASVLTPAEARDLSQDVFNRGFDNIKDDWTKKPLALSLAELNLAGKQGGPLDGFEDAGGMSTPNAGQAQRQAGVQQKPKTTPPDRTKPKPKSDDPVKATAKSDEPDVDTIVIKVPREKFMSWFDHSVAEG